MLTLMAISQYDDGLSSTSLAGSLIVVRAGALSCGSPSVRRLSAPARTELRIALDEPVEGVCIQKDSHGMYSAKSFRWSSSSETIVIIPLPNPGTRGLRSGGFSLTNFATG